MPTRFFASLKNDNVGNTAKDLGGMTNYRLSLRCMVVIGRFAVAVQRCKALLLGELSPSGDLEGLVSVNPFSASFILLCNIERKNESAVKTLSFLNYNQ